MLGLRQKLVLAFGGMLMILLIVSGLGIAVLKHHRKALDTFLYENWRSVEYGNNMIEALERLGQTAAPISGVNVEPSAAALSAARAAQVQTD